MGKILDLKEEAKSNHIPIMQDGGIEFIKEFIRDNNIKSVLELGTAVGYSAINFASVNNDVHILTVERDEERYNEALKNIHEFNLDNRIDVVLKDALEFETNLKFDLIFIDAAKSQYIKFFQKYKDNLNDNGVIITDNLSFHGMVEDITITHNRNTRQLVGKIKKYIEFLKENNEFDTTFYKIGDGVSVSRKKKLD